MIKKDIFNTWMKEFCSLVFVQSVQALTLALILSVVVGVLSDKPINQQDQVSAVGVLAIVALAAISKLEVLVKKVFGLNSDITDTSSKGGMKGLIGGVLAAKMAARTLNNVPKIAGGIRDTVGAKYDDIKARTKLANAKNRYDSLAKNGTNDDNEASNTPTTTTTTTTRKGSRNMSINDPVLNAAKERFEEVKAEGFEKGDEEYDKAYADYRNALGKAVMENGLDSLGGNGFDTTTVTTTRISNSSPKINTNANSNNSVNINKEKEKLNDAVKKYEDEIEKAKKRRSEGIKNISSGILETVGATAGGIAGGVMGIANGGDIDEIVKYTGIGMGVGDKAGKYAADIGSFDLSDTIKNIRESKAANERMIKAANIEIEGTRRKQVRKAKKEIEKMYNNIKIDAGNM